MNFEIFGISLNFFHLFNFGFPPKIDCSEEFGKQSKRLLLAVDFKFNSVFWHSCEISLQYNNTKYFIMIKYLFNKLFLLLINLKSFNIIFEIVIIKINKFVLVHKVFFIK